MKIVGNKSKKIEKNNLTDREKYNRERILLSLSYGRIEEATIATIIKKNYKIKISETKSISGVMLLKYFIVKGLDELDEKFGQIRDIKKIESIIDRNI